MDVGNKGNERRGGNGYSTVIRGIGYCPELILLMDP